MGQHMALAAEGRLRMFHPVLFGSCPLEFSRRFWNITVRHIDEIEDKSLVKK